MVRNASVILAAIGLSCIVPFDRPAARAEHMVVVPTTGGKDCIDLDSRWSVGAILSWRQTICNSDQEPVWVQTDCSQDFANKGYWLATSSDGKDFSRKIHYDADQFASSIAKFVCLSVGR